MIKYISVTCPIHLLPATSPTGSLLVLTPRYAFKGKRKVSGLHEEKLGKMMCGGS